jgi:hypothetical protein
VIQETPGDGTCDRANRQADAGGTTAQPPAQFHQHQSLGQRRQAAAIMQHASAAQEVTIGQHFGRPPVTASPWRRQEELSLDLLREHERLLGLNLELARPEVVGHSPSDRGRQSIVTAVGMAVVARDGHSVQVAR